MEKETNQAGMSNYFQPAGNLGPNKGDSDEKNKEVGMNKYFQPAGNLGPNKGDSDEKNKEVGMSNYFQPAGNLEAEKNNQHSFYYKATDLPVTESVTGLFDEGQMIVTKEKLREMIENGYNIIESEEIGQNLIAIYYKKSGRTR